MKARNFIKILCITIFSLFFLNTHGVAQIHYDNSGNVGIGTTNPKEELHIKSSVSDPAIYIESHQSGTHDFKIAVGNWGALDYGLNIIDVSAGIGRLFINNSGNIGIGTTNPQAN